MSDLLTEDLITYDPLSETTRKERTALLGLSVLGIALVKVPLIPEKIAFLGIEFAKIQQSNFIQLYALIVFYYLVAFSIYAFTDYVAWRRREVITLHEYQQLQKERAAKSKGELDALLDEKIREQVQKKPASLQPAYTGFAAYWLAHGAARARAVFEFILPIVLAIATLFLLLSYK